MYATSNDFSAQPAEGEEHEQQRQEILKIRDEIKRSNHRAVMAVAGTGLLLGGLVTYGLDGFTPALIGGAPLISWISGGLGAIVLLYALQD